MGNATVTTVVVGILFVFIFLSGILLRRSGRPLNTAIFTVHKLVGLGAGIYLVVTIYRMHQLAPLSAMQLVGCVVTAACFLGTVATGGLLSVEKPAPAIISALHKIIPALTLLSTAATLYLLLA